MNRHEWLSGNIPVIPFPAKDFAFAKSKLRYSHANFARYDVLIWAKPHAATGTTTFSMEMRAVGAGKQRHWLVDYFEPLGGGLSQPANPSPNPLQASAPVPSATKAPLGVAWVLVPLSVLALVVLIPTGLAIRGWRRNRRADRDYAADSSAAPAELLDVDLEPVARELEAVLERALERAVRQQQPLCPGRFGGLQCLDRAEVSARPAFGVRPQQRRLADEQVGVAGDVAQALARTGVAGVADDGPVRRGPEPEREQVVVQDACAASPRSPPPRSSRPLRTRAGRTRARTSPAARGAGRSRRAARALRVAPRAAGGADSLAGAEGRAPDPRDEVAPVVEVPMRDRDRVHAAARSRARAASPARPGPQSRSRRPGPSSR